LSVFGKNSPFIIYHEKSRLFYRNQLIIQNNTIFSGFFDKKHQKSRYFDIIIFYNFM